MPHIFTKRGSKKLSQTLHTDARTVREAKNPDTH